MSIFNKEKKEVRQQERATKKEERATMKRAEALASAIDTKSTENIPSFDAKKEEERVMKSKEPGLTVVEGAKPMTNEEQKVTRFSPEQAKEIEEKEESKVQPYRGPAASIINATQAINSDALKNAMNQEKQDVALNSALNADLKTKTDILESIEDANTLEDADRIKADSDAAEKLIQQQQTNLINASSNLLTDLGKEKDKPSYTGYATKEDIQKEIDKAMANYGSSAPAGVIEKLGVQDYYPQVGRDVAVGTFTGSRIGSQTIYSGAGALLPMGLYDARKRALADAAKQRQKDLDKYAQIPNTADQFNDRFANYAGKITYDILERNNYDPVRIGRDREGQIEMKRLEATGKKIMAIDKQIDAFLEAANPEKGANAAYIPPKMKDQMYDFKNGLVDNMEDYFSGKKDIGEFAENFRLYKDGTSWVDENFPKWTDESNKTQRSISLKTGVELTDKNIEEINNTIKALQSDGNPDYDTYGAIFKKYFSIDDKRVDNWLDLQGYPEDDLARETLKDYLNNLIPAASFVEEVKSNPNQNFGRWAKKMDLSIEKEKNKTFFTNLVEEASKQNVSGKAASIYTNWSNKSQDQKQNELAGIYQGLGVVSKNPKNKKDAYALINVDLKSAIAAPVSISKSNQTAMIELTDFNGNAKSVPISLAAKYLNKDAINGETLINGVKYKIPKNSDTYIAIKDFKYNASIPVIDNTKEVRLGYYGNDGNLYNVSTDNLGSYNSSNKKAIAVTVRGNAGVWRDVPDYTDENGKVHYKKELQKSNAKISYAGDVENDDQFRSVADVTQGQGQQTVTGGELRYRPQNP